MITKLHTVIFDFDGTIADTLSMTLSLANSLLIDFGYPEIDETEFQKLRKMTVPQGIKHLGLSPRHMPQALIKGRQLLQERLSELKPARGMTECIKSLSEIDGLVLGILSSNSKNNVHNFLERHMLVDKFNFVDAGASLFGKTLKIRQSIRRHRLSLDSTVYVGDEVRDIEAAKRVPLPIIAVGWGLNHPDVLKKYEPEYFANNSSELKSIIQAASNG